MLKLLKTVIATAILSTNLSLMAVDNPATLPAPYSYINVLPASLYALDNANVLSNLILTHSSGVVVDVESADGGFARFIAQQNIPNVQQIYCINPWSAQKNQFQRFLSNVIQENTAALIQPIRMNSLEAAKGLNIVADLVFLAQNGEAALYSDILAWFSHLSANGLICGNTWHDYGVPLAVTRAAADLDLVVRITENVWYLQRN